MNKNKITKDDWEQAKIPTPDINTENIKKLMELLNSPDEKIKIIHVGGTNGKGSVSEYLSSIFRTSGYKVGMFISPYLEKVEESINIDGIDISTEELQSLTNKLKELAKSNGLIISAFEYLVAASIIYFTDRRVDIAIIEVGIGGLNDATNVLDSDLVVFSSISMDHTNILGETIEDIAQEKAGIIKGSPVFSYPQTKEVERVLNNQAEKLNSQIMYLNKNDVENIKVGPDSSSFVYKNQEYTTNLRGEHQVYNASLSILVSKYLEDIYPNLKIKEGIRNARISSRIEVLDTNPKVIIDGAHNKESLNSLIEYLKLIDFGRLILGFSILKDKDIEPFVERLIPMADHIVLTEIDSPRAIDLSVLYEHIKEYTAGPVEIIPDQQLALNKSLEIAKEKDLVLWCGSFYLIKDIRRLYLDSKKGISSSE